MAQKGARLTTDITIPSRYLVFMPSVTHVGVSQRIEEEAERERLKGLVQEFCDENGGFILRTAAEGVGKTELQSDAAFLRRLWDKIQSRMKSASPMYYTKTCHLRVVYCETSLAQNSTVFALTRNCLFKSFISLPKNTCLK